MSKSKKNNIIFEKHNRSSGDRSSVWYYFLRSTDGLYAECQKCKKILKNSGSTSPLHNHLKLVHFINLKIDKGQNQPSTSSQKENLNINLMSQTQNVSNETCEPKKKKSKIDDFFKVDGDEYDDVQSAVSKMAALDGLPFRVFSTSETLRKLFKKSNYDLPQSHNAIKTMVMTKCEELKNNLKKEIHGIKANGHKFSASLDEWTSAKNRRYMNINIHSPELEGKPFRNLGLSRIRGRGTADNCYNILREKLSQFGLSIEDDIACIVTDGASVMRALGQKTSAQSQLCLAHGIQSAVLDVLYKKNSADVNPASDTLYSDYPETGDHDSDDSDIDSENEGDRFDVVAENATNVPLIVYKDLIYKVRQIVKYFKSSPTRTDHLNAQLGHDDKNLHLILDCKTRWSSLANMITRFLKLKDAIMKVLIDLKNETTFTGSEIETLKDLSISLNIIKATVEAILREDANLLTAETALKFMISKLLERDSTISRQLAESLKIRIIQRRKPEIVGTLKYLYNPAAFYAESSCSIFKNPSNDTITRFIINIIQKYFRPEATVTIDENDDADVALIRSQQQTTSEESLTFTEQINKEIDRTLSNTPSTSIASITPAGTEDLETLCRVQMALFDRGGPRNIHLSQVYNLLMTIPPTSVEAERVFSSTGYICNKLRTSLNDSTLDCLSFLRSYYQRLKM